jgi:class 3 adenylate cyclase
VPPEADAAPDRDAHRDEVRPITALFADVVGSTALGEKLTPDEVKILIGECVSRMSRVVEELGGVVQAYMGDGICAYFGVRAAHEDDPERAAAAALRLLREVGEYQRQVEAAWGISRFSIRVGVNTGQAGVGVVGAGDPQVVALGDTTNVAARLQAAAEPGSILVGEATARRLTDRFLLEPVGAVSVKGRTGTVFAWQLIGSRPALEAPAATPLVGREPELSRLESLITEFEAGRGQVLLLSGHAGMGKSRMLSELRRRLAGSTTWLEGRSGSFDATSTYGPFVEMLRAWLGVEGQGAEIAIRTRLRARLAESGNPELQDALPFLALLLGLRVESSATDPGASGDEVAGRIREAFRAWVSALAEQRPVVLAVDDLARSDPSTREMAEELLAVTDRAPVLFATALRPDPGSEGWRFRLRALADYAHRAVEIQLGPLSPDATRALVDELVPPVLVGRAARDEIVARAEGNPLYVQELLRTLVEAGGMDRRRTWTYTPGSVADLPPALEGLLVAQIDRLPEPARRLAQVAAAIGRDFPIRLLERVAETEDFQERFGALLRAEIIREVRRYPELECTFRHGLLQEAALSTLAPAVARELYGRIAAAVEELYSESVEDRLESIAFYLYRSDRPGRALDYLERAGERAHRLEASERARELWSRAWKLATRVGDAEAEKRMAERLQELGEPSA